MTSNPNSARDATKSRDASSSSPLERRTTPSTFSSSNRFSVDSTETGESSTVASQRNSVAKASFDEVDGKNGAVDVAKLLKDGRGSHRSHKSRNSGGFLLSNTAFEPPSDQPSTTATDHSLRHGSSHRDHKGKTALQNPEKKHTKRPSGVGLGIGNSPLAANVTNAGINSFRGDAARDRAVGTENTSGATAAAAGLDVDSAQIVNLALNLSESRRNAARRNVSSPLPPAAPGSGEGFAGGSLRQHFQQQRRASRNVSPKPERGDLTMTASPRIASGQRINSPLQGALDSHPQGPPYQYHFSASTLARAEKAKTAIELMAHYRRLLQHVPPLKPQALDRAITASSTGPESLLTMSRTASNTMPVTRQLGREYNPLQYIRNRKVRARERRAIDGEAQGFGDVDKVSAWVDQVSREASCEEYQAADCLLMPTFSRAADEGASPHNSPQSTLGKTQPAPAKVKRPRIDWVTNPADMIADVFWLEQDDNKKTIEDRFGQMIFPQRTELKRPMSRRSEQPESQKNPGSAIEREETQSPIPRIDTIFPEFKSVRSHSDKYSESATSKAKQKLRDATRIRHGHNGSIREVHHLRVGSHSRSASDSSDSDAIHHPRRRRSGTADSHDRGKDILEKQMMEMLAKETRESERIAPQDVEDKRIVQSNEAQKPILNESLDKAKINLGGHSRSGSIMTNKESHSRRGSFRNGSSGRASLEIPGLNGRGSLEGLDSTAPNSPQTKASKITSYFVPSIAMDLSPPPRSRLSSPVRDPLSITKSKANQFNDHGRDQSRNRLTETESPITLSRSKESTPDSPENAERTARSMNPIKKVTSRKTNESSKSILNAGSIRRGKGGDESSGIRGLFKGSRNPVARVSDFIWKKEPSAMGASSGFSTDESDIEDVPGTADRKGSRDSSAEIQFEDVDSVSPQQEKPYLNDMPVFSSPFQSRGRPTRLRADQISGGPLTQQQVAREMHRKASQARILNALPRIDVQNASPTSSPDLPPQDRFHRDSSLSDLESRRGSFPSGVQTADARLNAILGTPGHGNHNLPVTGLSSLEPSQNNCSPSEGKRQWSISDRSVCVHRGPMTKREIARVRALLLSSGIKAKEISRRAAETKYLHNEDKNPYSGIATLAREKVGPVPKSQEHMLAARILSDDIQLSSRMWQASAETFSSTTVQTLLERIDDLQGRLVENLTPMTRNAADEADEASQDLVTSQTLKVKRIVDAMDKMMRQRRRRLGG